MRPVSLLITHAGLVHVTSLTVCTHGRVIACHDRGISRACIMARCLLLVGFEMELASIVGWFPVWLVSRASAQ